MPSDRAFGQRTNMPVAEGLAKVRGREVQYGYAFAIKSGRDLEEALLTQGTEGLAMADTKISYAGAPFVSVHFPVFYGYDAKTRTVLMQEWSRGPVRMNLDDLKLDEVSLYFEPHKDLERFLTPEKQANWKDIQRARGITVDNDVKPSYDTKNKSKSGSKWLDDE